MTTLLLALALVSGLTTAEPASEPGPETPAPAVEPAAKPSGQPVAAKSPSLGPLQTIAVLAVAEGVLAFYSSIAASNPQPVGWVMVGLSPLVGVLVGAEAENKGEANSGTVAVASGLMIAGIGAYNVIELSKDRYSHSDRFWLNMAAWHVGFLGVGAVIAVADLAGGPRKAPTSTTPQVSLGLTPGGGALLVAGRF